MNYKKLIFTILAIISILLTSCAKVIENKSFKTDGYMLINGKEEGITKEDFYTVAEKAGIKKASATKCIKQVLAAIKNWDQYAKEAGISPTNSARIKRQLKTETF